MPMSGMPPPPTTSGAMYGGPPLSSNFNSNSSSSSSNSNLNHGPSNSGPPTGGFSSMPPPPLATANLPPPPPPPPVVEPLGSVNTGKESNNNSQTAAAKASPRFDKYSTSPRASSAKNNAGSQGSQNKKAPRIDPAQMPRPPPVETKVTYYTRSGSALRYPPPSTHCYTGIDLGNCNPRFMRCTTVSPATTHAIQVSCGLHLGLVVTPFAKLENEEEPMPVVNFENLPPRCHRCKAYVNLDVKWSNDGNKWSCNLCKAQNDVPSWYFSSLDGAGLRIDRGNRTELQYGSFDIVAPADYCVRPLQESIYLFAIDISPLAIETGLTDAAIDAVETVLGSLPTNESCKVGIFTFDSQIQFYTVRGKNYKIFE